TVNGYGGRQTKENEKSWCFKGWETLVLSFNTCLPYKCNRRKNTASGREENHTFISLTVYYAVFSFSPHFLNTKISFKQKRAKTYHL
ncbi:hypothetical protein, partial [Bacteroides uniformis]